MRMKQVSNDRKTTLTHGFVVGHEYEVIVRAVGPDGTEQAMEIAARNTITIVGKREVPNTPITLAASGFLNSIVLAWTNPLDFDFDKMEIWRSATNDVDTAAKVAEVRGISYTDELGEANVTRYYWIRAINTSGRASDYWPRTTVGVGATSVGVAVTDIDDFAITATKMFTKTIILTGDAWTNNYDAPANTEIGWNAHSIVYNGASYPITAGNTALAYIYWTIGGATYSTSATHPALGATAFMVAINTGGIHTLVWNSSANMVIGTAFIANLAVTDAKIATATITHGKIASLDAGTMTVGTLSGRTIQTSGAGGRIIMSPTAAVGLQMFNAADQLRFWAQIGGVADGDVTIGDYANDKGVKWDNSEATFTVRGLLNADDLVAGTVTGRTVQTASGAGKRIVLNQADNTEKVYNAANEVVIVIDDALGGFITVGYTPDKEYTFLMDGLIQLWSATDNKIVFCTHKWIADPGVWDQFTSWIDAEGDMHLDGVLGLGGNVDTAGVYKVAGTKVVDAQQAAVANATDAASVILRLNDLLARCRTHGLIDT